MRRPNFIYDFAPFDMAPAGAKLQRGRRLVVEPWERALLFRHGALVDTLGPGAYRRWAAGFTIRRVDTRPWIMTAPTQEVPTVDGVTVKVTVSGRVRVVDPTAFVLGTQNAHEAMYLAVQIALRELVAASSIDQLVSARADLGERLTASVRGLEDAGVNVEALELKDIVLPAELKRAQGEVLLARAQSVAALERARGETAALRNLANAARLAADNPALIQLRLIQELAAGSGHTVVIGAPAMLSSPGMPTP